MRTLSDTISRLEAFRALQMGGTMDLGTDRLSDLRDFGSNPGALRARIHLPKALPKGAPLVVVLHGCKQTAAIYDHGSGWSRLADEQGFAVLFPEQRRINNAYLCFNWFMPDDTRRDSGEALSIRQMIETIATSHNIDRKRIFITGFSAGGAMTSVMLATYPDVFAGGAIIAGLPYGSAATVPQAFDRMRGHGAPTERALQSLVSRASRHNGRWPTLSIWHGTMDRTVHPSNADAIIRQWRGLHGLGATPTRVEKVDGYPRRVWCDAHGRELIEDFSIIGMGHGTPIGVAENNFGATSAYMLDVGISSTHHIAKFWRLTPSVDASAKIVRRRSSASRPYHPVVDKWRPKEKVQTPRSSKRDGRIAQPSQPQKSRVRKAIEYALRSVGLLR